MSFRSSCATSCQERLPFLKALNRAANVPRPPKKSAADDGEDAGGKGPTKQLATDDIMDAQAQSRSLVSSMCLKTAEMLIFPEEQVAKARSTSQKGLRTCVNKPCSEIFFERKPMGSDCALQHICLMRGEYDGDFNACLR